MHLLSASNRSEFLAVPGLVRFTVAQGSEGPEATLLIKGATLALKYVISGRPLKLALFRIGADWLAYGVEVPDDPDHPALLWSILETQDELTALKALVASPACVAFLFNEAVVNVAWANVTIDLSDERLASLVRDTVPADANDSRPTLAVQKLFAESGDERPTGDGRVYLELPQVAEWHPIQSYYLAGRMGRSPISIFEKNEGAQQEHLALWLIDNLQPEGAVRNPDVHEPKGKREFSDLVLNHDYGPFLIESKALALLSRPSLPSRAELTADVVKHVRKATKQLVGGVKNLKRGYPITDHNGREVQINRTHPPHLIVLVPDLSLLGEETDLGPSHWQSVMKSTGGFYHILDPVELLRMVQVAEMIAAKGTTTPLMAFDWYLMERVKVSVGKETPYFGMIAKGGDVMVVQNE